jgi:hypothetical protein
MPNEKKRIILGSGDIYVDEFTGEIPENSVLEVQEKRLGEVSGGATLEYKPTYYTAQSDLGRAMKTILTGEEVTLKSGVMTINASTLDKLSDTARSSVSTDGKMRILKVGGAGNQRGKRYVVHFHHRDAVDGDIRVTIVGNNQAGFSLAFQKDKETVVDAEFKALSMDDDGTLIIYQEEIMDADESEADPGDDTPAPSTHTLTITAGTGGTITTGEAGEYAAGAQVSIAAQPNSGYTFDEWSGTGGGTFADTTSAATTFTMPDGDAAITATFAEA